jgi:hypothetical protein
MRLPGDTRAVQCSAVQCSAVQFSSVQHSAIQHKVDISVQHSTIPCSAI